MGVLLSIHLPKHPPGWNELNELCITHCYMKMCSVPLPAAVYRIMNIEAQVVEYFSKGFDICNYETRDFNDQNCTKTNKYVWWLSCAQQCFKSKRICKICMPAPINSNVYLVLKDLLKIKMFYYLFYKICFISSKEGDCWKYLLSSRGQKCCSIQVNSPKCVQFNLLLLLHFFSSCNIWFSYFLILIYHISVSFITKVKQRIRKGNKRKQQILLTDNNNIWHKVYRQAHRHNKLITSGNSESLFHPGGCTSRWILRRMPIH